MDATAIGRLAFAWRAPLSGWLGRRRRRRADRQARRALAGLDDRQLRDIGLTRADVERELLRPAREPVDWDALERQRRANGGWFSPPAGKAGR